MDNKITTKIDKTQKDTDPVVTRSYLVQRFEDFGKKMDKKFEEKGEELRIKLNIDLDDKLDDFKQFITQENSKIFDIVDGLAGEVIDGREFRKINIYRQVQHSDRIERLEKKVFGKVQSA